MRKDSGVGDGVAGPGERVIVVGPLLADGLAADNGGVVQIESSCEAGVLAHVAILAGDAFLGGRRGAVLFPDDFEFDLGLDGHLMARDAEIRAGYLGEVEDVRCGCPARRHRDPVFTLYWSRFAITSFSVEPSPPPVMGS